MLGNKSIKSLSYVLSACLLVSPLSFSKTLAFDAVLTPSPGLTAQIDHSTDTDISKIFAPRKKTLNYTLDYTKLDVALGEAVIQMGPSLRRFKKKPRSSTGSRIISKSQTSRYRLEGSRVTFHYLSEKYKKTLSDYKTDLIRIANDVDIQSLDRDEQLAFWMNLHNVTLIDAIAQQHPTTYPVDLKFGENDLPLHEAKLVTIRNTPLSLKNIREDIVYANWDNAAVIYGFFRGDIGGPGLREFAITKNNIDYLLASNAYEYITSLRGFHTTRKNRKVSKIYDEAKPYFFSDWPRDLESHFKFYLKGNSLLDQVNEDKPWDLIDYDFTIADLWGGDNSLQSATVSSAFSRPGAPPVLLERRNKLIELKRKGKRRTSGTVTIEDIVTSSSPEDQD